MKKYVLLILFCTAKLTALPGYFCTAANYRYYPHLLNLIGSIHKSQFDSLIEIAVFDLGLTPDQRTEISKIDKVKLYKFKNANPYILAPFLRDPQGSWIPGWYAWKYVALRQILEVYPYVLWIDAGSTVLRPLDDLFTHIQEQGYFLATIGDGLVNGTCVHTVGWGATKRVRQLFQLERPDNQWVLNKESVMGGVQGVSRTGTSAYLDTMCLFAEDLRNFEDDGSTPNGFGTGRHDQPLLGALGYLKHLKIAEQDHTQRVPITFTISNLVASTPAAGNSVASKPTARKTVEFHMTHLPEYVDHRTHIYSSRGDIKRLNEFLRAIRLKPGVYR